MPKTNSKSSLLEINPKREQILQGAMKVFLQPGYAGASMDRVAEVAKVSKNTIYNHFQDKEGLFTALIEQITTNRFQIVFGSVPLKGEPAVVLRQIAEKLLSVILSDREYICFLRLLIAESERFPKLAQLFISHLPKKVLSILGEYFRSHPELKLPNPEATARIFMSSLIGYVLTQEILQGKEIIPLSQEDLIASLIVLISDRNHEQDSSSMS
ncbi:MAG: TetR/AcrR family transcriptional regulator [Waterburya sp.]